MKNMGINIGKNICNFLSQKKLLLILLLSKILIPVSFGSEANLVIPNLNAQQNSYLELGIVVSFCGLLFGIYHYLRIRSLPAHQSMLDVANVIYETCKTYLFQQGKFLLILFVFIGAAIIYYFGFLQHQSFGNVLFILMWTVIGVLGSYVVAFFGIRINTLANSRMAFAALKKDPYKLLAIPLNSGMSIGVTLISVELIIMLIILLYVPRDLAGASFIGFAIGESLGASALRIAGGIFTKIADIGSDLMKIVFKIKEDDPRNPGVIADCTGDNAGDSVGPTADGFETYGVTGVALISFIVLAVGFDDARAGDIQATLLTWIFVMRVLMVITSILAYAITYKFGEIYYRGKKYMDFEQPLTALIWFTSIISIVVTFLVSYFLIGPNSNFAELIATYGDIKSNLWLVLSGVISCGTVGAALIPEAIKIFTSPKSAHVREVVNSGSEGGASLTILSGLTAGNFSAFWVGIIFFGLMFVAYTFSKFGIGEIMIYPAIFSFGLVAFGFLGMGPVTIAVDSYGPVTDNAQSIYELSLIEEDKKQSTKDIERDFGFTPDFELAKEYLEENDGAGNTFKATSKPVLIGTAIVGATTMVFSLILLIQRELQIEPNDVLNLLNPWTIFGFIMGGAVIYWFSGASTQAVSTGAFRAVEYIKKNIRLDESADAKASIETSKEVVAICTHYAQLGMFNIFVVIASFTLAMAFLSAPDAGFLTATDPKVRIGLAAPLSFFVSYLLSLTYFGLFQAVFMANAGGCWDNAKKVVETDKYLKATGNGKGSHLHDATVVGDTVGDPFKDTSSVSLNPVIKFATLFGLLAMEIAITNSFQANSKYIGMVFFIVALFFVYRSFYKMRIVSNIFGKNKSQVIE